MKRPQPFITQFEDAPFWKYCSKEQLHIQRCKDCNQFWWPIGPVCPGCMGESYEWSPVKGVGQITNYVVYHKVYYTEFEGRTPYLVAEIGLPEGVRLVGNVEGIKDLRDRKAIVGAKVQLYFEECNDGLKIPQWRIAK